jgi:hypothetical protein
MGLAILSDLAFESHGFCISCYSSKRDINEYVPAICTGLQAPGAVNTMAGTDMLGEFQMQKRPQLTVPFQDNMASPAPVPTIGATPRSEPGPQEMLRTRTSISGSAEDLYIIYKI